jgi:putative transposase
MNALASLSESARKIALDRFRLLQPHLEEERPLKAVARDAGIGYRTAQRWKMRYRKYGLAGLARDDRSDRGWRRAITVELKEILEALALQKPPLPIAALHRCRDGSCLAAACAATFRSWGVGKAVTSRVGAASDA